MPRRVDMSRGYRLFPKFPLNGPRVVRYGPLQSLAEASLIVLVLLARILPCAGQQVNATLTGAVRDSSGAVVPGAALTAKNESTGVVATTVSDGLGNYVFPSLPPATYTLSAERRKLIRVEVEVPTVGFGQLRAAQGWQADLGHQHRAQQ